MPASARSPPSPSSCRERWSAPWGSAACAANGEWPAELIPRLQLLADVFASVLARQRADSAVRESDERRRQAEKEAHRQREELAHALRVTTLSELTASLAHELTSP